jgi:hypothetical protein
MLLIFPITRPFSLFPQASLHSSFPLTALRSGDKRLGCFSGVFSESSPTPRPLTERFPRVVAWVIR